MGNCQAVDNEALLIQHTNGRVDKLYSPVTANEIMKMNSGHYVALLLTTTLYSNKSGEARPVRVTKIKLLRPSDTLVLGHVYRLVTTQEVMKGLWAKKQAKVKNQEQPWCAEKILRQKLISSDIETVVRGVNQVKQDRHRSRNSCHWQPSLKSISEADDYFCSFNFSEKQKIK